MSKIFGGSKSKSTQQSTSSSTSSNRAYDTIANNYAPIGQQALHSGIGARDAILGGGFDEYKRQGGFDFQMHQGLNNLLGNYGGRGVVRSGAAMKALERFGTGLSNAYLNDYLNQQMGQAQLGAGLGQLLAGAGGVSSAQSQSTGQSTSRSSPGLGGFIGAGLSAFAGSDRRLKKNVVKLAELSDGLGVYKYDYINDFGPHIGVMAEEVAKLRPEALGPEVGGYMTVDYSKIEELV